MAEVKFKELNHIMESTDALYHKAALKLGLSGAEMTILYILYETGDGCPQREIYARTGISKSTINTAIKKMESEGFITLKATDGRSTAIFPTKEGKALIKNTIGKLVGIENSIYESWSIEDREAILRLNRDYMEKFAAGVEKL